MFSNISEILELADAYEVELPPAPPPIAVDIPLASFLDCAMHNPDATPSQIEQLCIEACEYKYATVFVNPIFVPQVSRILEGSGVNVGTVAGFPLGGFPTRIKVDEARYYIEGGANEIDMVIAVGLLKAGRYEVVFEDIQQVAETVHRAGGILKVILEMVLLNRREKIIGCLLSKTAGADFVKTSTGFCKGGATVEDVDLMRRVVGPADRMGVKAAGGIHSLGHVMTMINAGANRLGTRLGAKIIQEYQKNGFSKGVNKR